MYSMIQPPTKKISKESVKVWRMTETITNLVILAVLSILLYVDNYFAWKEWISLRVEYVPSIITRPSAGIVCHSPIASVSQSYR